jgi:hypothetical protein
MTKAHKTSVYAARSTIITKAVFSKTVRGLIAATAIGGLYLTAAQAQTGGHAASSSGSSPRSSAPPPTVTVPAQPGPTFNSSSPNTMTQSPETPVSPSTPGVGSSVYGSGSGTR